jgi:hypothetical protein
VLAWSNRLMLRADRGDAEIELYYRGPEATQGAISRVSPSMEKLAVFLGHTTTIESPEPGLGLSYAETVGAIHQIWRQGFVKADFKAEQDRILAAILDRERTPDVTERPEFAEPGSETLSPTAAGGALDAPADQRLPRGAAEAAVPRGRTSP